MSTSAITVTTTIVVAWVLAVRRAWVPRSVLLSQSQNPVSAARTETAAPPTNTNVPAWKKSRAQVSCRPSAAMTSKSAPKMYAATGKSVNGGWSGFPAQPRRPLNFRPFSVSVGRTEYLRISSHLSLDAHRVPSRRQSREHHTTPTVLRVEARFEPGHAETLEESSDQ